MFRMAAPTTTSETWSAVLRRLVRQEEAREREKLARRRLEVLRDAAHLSSAATPASSGAVSTNSSEKGGGQGENSADDEAQALDPSDKARASETTELAVPGVNVASASDIPREEDEDEEDEGDSDFLQKHLLSREDARWVCLEDAQQANCVALNRRRTLFAVGERDGRVSIWDNVSLRVITRELDPTSIAVPDEAGADSGNATADEHAGGSVIADTGAVDGQTDGNRSCKREHKAADEEEDDDEDEEAEDDEDAETNEYSTGNDDASVEADDEDTASVEEGDASTEEDDDHHEPIATTPSSEQANPETEEGSEDQSVGVSVTDLRRVRSSLKVVTQCAWSCDSRWIFAGCEEKSTRKGILCVWDVEASTLVATYSFDAIINCISVHPSDPTLVIVCSYNAVPVLINLATRKRERLSAIPLENASLTISIPSNSRHPSLIVAARYGASGEFIYAATTKATVAVLDASTFECVHKVELNVLIQYLDMAVSGAETVLLITSSKGIHEFSITRATAEGESNRVSLAEKWLLSTGAVRAPWALCSFTGDEKYAIGVPVVRHRHVGENGLYTWDRSTGRVQHNAGVKDGVNALAWDTHRDGLLTASATGALYVFEEAFTTTWPGSMYPASFRLITDNELHHESFDVEDARERERADKEFERTLSEEKEPIDLFAEEVITDSSLAGSAAEPVLPAAPAIPALPPVENELLYLPAIPIIQQPLKRHGHLFQGSDYHDEKHFGLGQSVFEPLKVPAPKKSRPSGKSKKRKSGLVEIGAAGSSSKSKSSKRSGGSSNQKRRRR